jgi:hypothetical protein
VLDMVTWTFELPILTEGCCDGVVIYRAVETYTFGSPLHTEGYYDGMVIRWVARPLPCRVVLLLLT